MEVPVAVVVEVVDACGQRPLAVDLPLGPRIDGEVLARRHVGEAVDVAVVQRAELLAAVARPQAQAQVVPRLPLREQRRPPARHARLPFADRVAGHRRVAAVGQDDRVREREAARQRDPLGQRRRAAELHPARAHVIDVLHRAGRGAHPRIDLRIERIPAVLVEQRDPQAVASSARPFGAELAGPAALRLQQRVAVDEVAGRVEAALEQLAHGGKAHRASGAGLQHPVLGEAVGQRRLRRPRGAGAVIVPMRRGIGSGLREPVEGLPALAAQAQHRGPVRREAPGILREDGPHARVAFEARGLRARRSPAPVAEREHPRA